MGPRYLWVYVRVRLVIPVASDLMEVGASLGAHVGDDVEAAVDVGEVLVEGYIKHCQLVVVAQQALEECLVAQGEGGKVVVAAVNEEELRALLNCKAGEVVVRANEVDQVLAVTHCEALHIVVGANEGAQ